MAPHFAADELACRDGSDAFRIHPVLLCGLEILRDRLNQTRAYEVPIIVTSAYRTPEWNALQGGKANSQHLLGLAADIQAPGVRPAEIQIIAEIMGFGGIGSYDDFTHLDVGPPGRRW